MIVLLLTTGAIILVTIAAAWLLERRRPAAAPRAQIWAAACSFPVLSCLLFVLAVANTLAFPPTDQPGDPRGMVIFAMLFFLVYALVAGFAIGLPTAFLAIRYFRRR